MRRRVAGPRRVYRPLIEPVPGVYTPTTDSMMLLDAFLADEPEAPASVLELCCGSGIVAIAAALQGHHVDAVDNDRLAVNSARRNAELNGAAIGVFHGDLFGPVEGACYDAVLANPPYVPTPEHGDYMRHGWCDGGADGREVIDRICSEVDDHLLSGGALYLVQSSLADTGRTLRALSAEGMQAEVIASRAEPLGPISSERRRYLLANGHLASGENHEQIDVIRARSG